MEKTPQSAVNFYGSAIPARNPTPVFTLPDGSDDDDEVLGVALQKERSASIAAAELEARKLEQAQLVAAKLNEANIKKVRYGGYINF